MHCNLNSITYIAYGGQKTKKIIDIIKTLAESASNQESINNIYDEFQKPVQLEMAKVLKC